MKAISAATAEMKAIQQHAPQTAARSTRTEMHDTTGRAADRKRGAPFRSVCINVSAAESTTIAPACAERRQGHEHQAVSGVQRRPQPTRRSGAAAARAWCGDAR